MQDETMDPMYQAETEMRGLINTKGVEEAARIVADGVTPPFNMGEHARLQGIIRAAFHAGLIDGMTNKDRVY